MSPTLEIGYLGIEVDDPDAYTEFFGEVIGLMPGAGSVPGTVTWTDDDAAQRLVLECGPANDAVYVGFVAADDAAFDAHVARLTAAGFEVTLGTDAQMRARRVERLAVVAAPWGVSVELACGLEPGPTPFASALMPGGFLTEGVGFGHAVFATTALDASHRFLVEGLGMAQSDWIETEIAPGIELEVRFYHCNARHHTVALARAPFELPQSLHHVMFETKERDDVGRAYDRAFESGRPIANALGRHDNDGMFSFYVVSPGGFQVEVGFGARTITADWSENRRYDRISSWGHQPVTRP